MEQIIEPQPSDNRHEEAEIRTEVTSDIVEYADEFLASGTYDSVAKARSWRHQDESAGSWQIVHLTETNHYMIERSSRTGKQRLYCIDGNEFSLWGIIVNQDFEQEPTFVSTEGIKEIRGLFRNIAKGSSQ